MNDKENEAIFDLLIDNKSLENVLKTNLYNIPADKIKIPPSNQEAYDEARKFGNIFTVRKKKSNATNDINMSNLYKKFKNYYRIDLSKYSKRELSLPRELYSMFVLMMHMNNDSDNILADGMKNKPNCLPKEIGDFLRYNDKVISGVEKLPEQIQQHIKSNPTYEYNYCLQKYMPIITERLIVLMTSIINATYSSKHENISDFLYSTLTDIDKVIENIFGSAKNHDTYYFDKLFSEIFKKFDKNRGLQNVQSKRKELLENIHKIEEEGDDEISNLKVERDNKKDEVYRKRDEDVKNKKPRYSVVEQLKSIEDPYNKLIEKAEMKREELMNRAKHKAQKDYMDFFFRVGKLSSIDFDALNNENKEKYKKIDAQVQELRQTYVFPDFLDRPVKRYSILLTDIKRENEISIIMSEIRILLDKTVLNNLATQNPEYYRLCFGHPPVNIYYEKLQNSNTEFLKHHKYNIRKYVKKKQNKIKKELYKNLDEMEDYKKNKDNYERDEVYAIENPEDIIMKYAADFYKLYIPAEIETDPNKKDFINQIKYYLYELALRKTKKLPEYGVLIKSFEKELNLSNTKKNISDRIIFLLFTIYLRSRNCRVLRRSQSYIARYSGSNPQRSGELDPIKSSLCQYHKELKSYSDELIDLIINDINYYNINSTDKLFYEYAEYFLKEVYEKKQSKKSRKSAKHKKYIRSQEAFKLCIGEIFYSNARKEMVKKKIIKNPKLQKRKKYPNKPKDLEPFESEIRKLYEEEGISLRYLSKKYNCSVRSLRVFIEEKKIVKRKKKNP